MTTAYKDLPFDGKECPTCNTWKTLVNFYFDKRRQKHSLECKKCRKNRRDCWVENNREHYNRTNTARKIKNKYDVSIEERDAIIKQQGGLCFFGHEPDNRGLAIEHNHKTGKLRHMVCFKCNSGIAFANEDPSLLRAWALYIEETRG